MVLLNLFGFPQSHTMDMSLSKLREIEKDREAWRPAVRGVAKDQTWLSEQQPHSRLLPSDPLEAMCVLNRV